MRGSEASTAVAGDVVVGADAGGVDRGGVAAGGADAGGAVPAMTDARRRVLAVLAERPVALGVEQVRALLGGHPNGIRRHLAALVRTGLAVRELRTTGGAGEPGGPGRPTHRYRASALGARAHALGRAERQGTGYAAIAGSLVAALESAATPERARRAAREAGRAWGENGGVARGGGIEQLVAVLAGQGYDPVSSPAVPCGAGPTGPAGPAEPAGPAGAVTIRLRACPMLDLALEHPDVVCSVHRGLLEALAGSQVVLEPFAGPDGCVVRIDGPNPSGQ